MKEFFLEEGRYQLSKVDGRNEAPYLPESEEFADLMLAACRPRVSYDTNVAFLGLLEDASASDMKEIFLHLNQRLGFCRPMTANELYDFARQHPRLDIGRDIFAVGSAVRRMYNGEACDPSWVRWESRAAKRPGQAFVYPSASQPGFKSWKESMLFEGGCNQRISIIVTKPCPIIGADFGTFAPG